MVAKVVWEKETILLISSIERIFQCVLDCPSIIIALLVAACAGLLLRFAFKQIRSCKVKYHSRAACEWYEAAAHNCCDVPKEFPQQSFNTYSNLMYIFVGTLAAFTFAKDTSGVLFLVVMTLQCIGSALYHGIPTRWSGHFDVIGIYLFLATLLSLAFFWLVDIPESIFGPVVFLAAIVVACGARIFPKRSKPVNPTRRMNIRIAWLLGSTVAIVSISFHVNNIHFVEWLLTIGLSLLVFCVAFILQRLDSWAASIVRKYEKKSDGTDSDATGYLHPKWFCKLFKKKIICEKKFPTSLHGCWHISSAIAILIFFRGIHWVQMEEIERLCALCTI